MSARADADWVDILSQRLTDYVPVLQAVVKGFDDVLAALPSEQE